MRDPGTTWVMTISLLAATPLSAAPVQVTATGEVEYNQISAAPLGNVNPGDPVTMTFSVDSTRFVNSASFPTRGYIVEQSSFTLTLGSTVMSVQHPFPAGEVPYFVIRNNDPAVDGFWVSTNVDFPLGVPINQTGSFGPFIGNYSVTYTGDTLVSLDILDAVGSDDFTGLTVFHWTVNDGPFEPLGMVIEQLTLSVAAPCAADLNGSGTVDAADLALLLGAWGSNPGHPADFNGDDAVNAADLALLLGAWGPCP